jgi:hypothetical protein
MSSLRMLKEMVPLVRLGMMAFALVPQAVGSVRWGHTGVRVQSATSPVSWKTGPASLAGCAFSSDIEGDGPRGWAGPILPKEYGLRSAGRLALAAVVCQRFWRRWMPPSSSSRVAPGALGVRPPLSPRSLSEDCGCPSCSPVESALERPPRGLSARRDAAPGSASSPPP